MIRCDQNNKGVQTQFWTNCSKIFIGFIASLCAAIWPDPSKYLGILIIRGYRCRHVHRAVMKSTKDPHQRLQENVFGATLSFGILFPPKTFANR